VVGGGGWDRGVGGWFDVGGGVGVVGGGGVGQLWLDFVGSEKTVLGLVAVWGGGGGKC